MVIMPLGGIATNITLNKIDSQLLLFVAEHPLFTLQLHGANQNTSVVCSATGGYPPIANISLLKNGNVVTSTATESRLQVNTADIASNHFGLYVCLVNLSGVTLQQNVVLKERGIVTVLKPACSCCYIYPSSTCVIFIMWCMMCDLLHDCLFSGELQIQLDMSSDSCIGWTVSAVYYVRKGSL